MAIKKQYLKSKPVCKVTFKIEPRTSQWAREAWVTGDFNGWSTAATPMKRLKNGGFSLTLNLEKDRKYAFRYLLEGGHWLNEDEADGSAPTPYPDSVNSLLIL